MSSVSDWLFGDQESTKGMDIVKGDNQRRLEFVQEQTAQARNDIQNLIPDGARANRVGYRHAIQAAKSGPNAQIDVLRQSGREAQRSLVDGMNEYRAAIMGQPSQINPEFALQNPAGFVPIAAARAAAAKRPFTASFPGFLLPQDAAATAAALSGQTVAPEAPAQPQATDGRQGPIQVPWGSIGGNINWSSF
jgi:hypothetical protein